MDVIKKVRVGYKRNWMAIGIGEAGSRALSDFLTFSDYAEGNIGVAYFMDTRRDNLSDTKEKRLQTAKTRGKIIFEEDLRSIPRESSQTEEKESQEIKREFKTEPELSTKTIIKFINYGEEGTGRSWPTSEFLMKRKLLMDEERNRSSTYLNNLTEDCQKLVEDILTTDIVMIFHSLGGGTGGGGASILSRWIQEISEKRAERTRVVSICFLHFLSGIILLANSVRNLYEVSKAADFVILFSNEILKKKLGLSHEPEGKKVLHDLNREITRTLDILLSSTSYKTEVTGTIDPRDISSCLTVPIDEKLNLNILVPFVSQYSRSFQGELISLQDSLHNPLAPIRKGEVLQLLPIFLSSKEEISTKGYLENKQDEITEQVKKVLRTDKAPNIEEFFGVFDGKYGDKTFVDTLVLVLANVDLTSYLSVLDSPIVEKRFRNWQIKALKEFGSNKEVSDNWFNDLKEQIIDWNANYQQELQILIQDGLRG